MAALATVLSSTISPAVKQQQDAARAAKQKIRAGLQQACDENIQGFEKTYRITFYASLLALIIGAFLPGWPAKWLGRGVGPGAPAPAGGH